MDKFVKRYFHYEKDENGNEIQVRNKIFRRNPELSEAFTCDQNVILAKLQLEAMAMRWRLPGLLLYVYVLYITDTLSSHFGSL
jgi:hypothetical protein